MKKILILFLTVILAGNTVGCKKEEVFDTEKQVIQDTASVSLKDGKSETEDLPESYFITGDNYFDYQPGFECSAFSSAYVLRHFGEEADGMKLFEDFPGKLESGDGVLPGGMLTFFDDRGYEAEFNVNGTVDDLKRALSEGSSVIVFIHVSEPYDSPQCTHYTPLVGYDKEYFYFAESLDYLANCKDEKEVPYNRKTDYDKFSRLWLNINGYWDNPYFVINKK